MSNKDSQSRYKYILILFSTVTASHLSADRVLLLESCDHVGYHDTAVDANKGIYVHWEDKHQVW